MSHRLRVIVINDDPSSLKMLTSVLSSQYVVIPFLSPTEAVDYLEEHTAPDALLTDLHMPELDGWSLCRLLKSPQSPWRELPIVLLSSFASGIDAEEISRELGAQGFISLPQPPLQLLAEVQRLLEGEETRPTRYALVTSEQASGLSRAICQVLETTGAQADEYLSTATLTEQLESYQAVLFTDDVPHLERTLMQFDRPQRCTVMLVLSLDKSLEKAQALLLAGADAVLNHGFSSQDLKRTLEDVHRARALLRIPELERTGKNPSAVSEKID